MVENLRAKIKVGMEREREREREREGERDRVSYVCREIWRNMDTYIYIHCRNVMRGSAMTDNLAFPHLPLVFTQVNMQGILRSTPCIPNPPLTLPGPPHSGLPRAPFPVPHQATITAWEVFVSRPSRRLRFLAALTTSSLVWKSPRDHSCIGLSPYCIRPT